MTCCSRILPLSLLSLIAQSSGRLQRYFHNETENENVNNREFYYLRQGERSEHWRRLRNDVIAPTAQTATPVSTPAITFSSLPCSEAALSYPSSSLVFKSLYLAEICTLTSVF